MANDNILKQTINEAMRKVDSTLYNKASDKAKTETMVVLSKQIFETRIVDFIKGVKDVMAPFYVEKVQWGQGWRELTAGLVDIDEYSSNPEKRLLSERRFVKEYKEEFTDIVRDFAYETYNEVMTQEFFKNSDGLNQWLTLNAKRISDSFAIRNFQFIKYVFDETTYDDTSIKSAYPQLTKNYKDIADKWKQQFAGAVEELEKEADETTQDALVKGLINIIKNMTIEPTSRYNLDRNSTELLHTIQKDDLIMIISASDKAKFDYTTRSKTFNSELFNFPDVKTMEFNIPSGTAYIIHKDLIKISPYFEKMDNIYYPTTLDTDLIMHLQNRVGMSQYAPFIKLKVKA